MGDDMPKYFAPTRAVCERVRPNLYTPPEVFQQRGTHRPNAGPLHVEQSGWGWFIVDEDGRTAAHGPRGQVGFRSQGLAEYVLSLGLVEER